MKTPESRKNKYYDLWPFQTPFLATLQHFLFGGCFSCTSFLCLAGILSPASGCGLDEVVAVNVADDGLLLLVELDVVVQTSMAFLLHLEGIL